MVGVGSVKPTAWDDIQATEVRPEETFASESFRGSRAMSNVQTPDARAGVRRVCVLLATAPTATPSLGAWMTPFRSAETGE